MTAHLPEVGAHLRVTDYVGDYPVPSLPMGTLVEVVAIEDHLVSLRPLPDQPGVTPAMLADMAEWHGCWHVYDDATWGDDDGLSLAEALWERCAPHPEREV